MMNYIKRQFGQPTGLVGGLVGQVMAYENRERNGWAVGLLALQERDRVLEIGFGPGLAIAEMAARVTAGHVAGVDGSAVMLRQAGRRNARAIAAGQVTLQQGTVADLPFEPDTFDKALTVNSVHHWPEPEAGLRELCRVLRPGGRLVVVEQPHGAHGDGVAADVAQRLTGWLQTAGFKPVETAVHTPGNGAPCVGIVSVKAGATSAN